MSSPRCPICRKAEEQDPQVGATSTGAIITGVSAVLAGDYDTLAALHETFNPFDMHIALQHMASLLVQEQMMTGVPAEAVVARWRADNDALLSS